MKPHSHINRGAVVLGGKFNEHEATSELQREQIELLTTQYPRIVGGESEKQLAEN